MSKPKKSNSFTFEIGDDFKEQFNKFQVAAGADQRSTAAMIRFLIQEHLTKIEAKA